MRQLCLERTLRLLLDCMLLGAVAVGDRRRARRRGGRLRSQDREGPRGAEHAADPRQAGRRRQAALDHATGRSCCTCTATTSRRRSSRARSPKWRSRRARRDGSRSKSTSRTPRAVTRMVRLRLSASRSARARAVRPRLLLAAAAHARGGGTPAQRARLRPALRAAAAARALPVRRGGGGCAVVRRVRAVRAPRAVRPRAARQIDLLADPLGRIVGHPAVVLALRLAVLALFVVAILAGLFGDQNPYRNIAPTLVWIIWWVGLAYVCGLRRRRLGARQSLAHRLRRGAMAVPAARRERRARLGPALPAERSASGRPASCCSPSPGSSSSIPNAASPAHIACAGHRLFGAHLGRHAGVRSRHLAAARRGVLAGVRHASPASRRPRRSDGRLLLRPFGAGLLDEPRRSRRR